METNLRCEYEALIEKISNSLISLIANSNVTSEHVAGNCIKVDLFDYYTELVIVNDELTFLDYDGYHHSLLSDCDINDLINLITINEN
jgi:hypothetical protein